ncbi:MAG: gluconate 2-dehydrogenase subunit 3 family protein [Imperialibacter sp.]|uniref:gluconate 2-dehydrogenase subunit 3 family protein n=1 Tax=Imperialibacter sp. TaxID=2038411 RepID=UPI003A880057
MERREVIRRMALSMGYTLSAPAILSILNSCESAPELGWQPLALTPEQAAALDELTETILPKTSTPGARDMKVAQTMDAFISAVFSPTDQEQFKSDLDGFLKECETMQGKTFVKCSQEERNAFLAKYDTPESYGISVWGTDMAKKEVNAVFKKVKAMTVSSYLNTEELGERILRYQPIPGKYVACQPYEKGTKVWSL